MSHEIENEVTEKVLCHIFKCGDIALFTIKEICSDKKANYHMVMNMIEPYLDAVVWDVNDNPIRFKLNSIGQRYMTGKTAKPDKETGKMKNSKVFIAHGSDEAFRDKVVNFIYQMGLTPIVLKDQADGGRVLIEKFVEEVDSVSYGIVLYTPCDKGRKRGERLLNDRARQNVVFEHGYLLGVLGRSRVSIIYKGNLELPSDIKGIVYKADEDLKLNLATELDAAGFSVKFNKSNSTLPSSSEKDNHADKESMFSKFANYKWD